MSRGEMDEQVRAYWTPGRSHGLVWSQGVALVEASMPIEAAVELWERCQQGVSMGEFLEALSTCSGAGLLTLPSFVVVLDAGTATHIAARGDLSVSAFINDKPEDISGGQVTTWVERQLARVDGFVLRDESGPQADQTARPLVGGLVAAAELRRGINGKTPNANPLVECVPAAGEFVVPISEPAAAAESRLGSDAAQPQAAECPAVAVVEEAPEDERPAPQEPPVSQPSRDASTLVAEELPQQPAHQSDVMPSGASTLVPPELMVDAPVPPEPSVDLPVVQSPYDVLWGETRAFVVEQAAVAPQAEEGGPRAVGPQSLAEVNDHDSMTIMSLDDLAPAEGQPRASEPSLTGMSVVATYCPMGHPNPPHRTECRSCGAPLLGEPARIPRPAMGWVRTPGGERVELVTPLVIGRNPRAERIQGTDLPRLISVPNGHVSSNHLEIRLEGWNVLAVDLHSRNGTFLRRPGQPPMRLPEQPTMIISGDVLDLGHGVQFSFEELP